MQRRSSVFVALIELYVRRRFNELSQNVVSVHVGQRRRRYNFNRRPPHFEDGQGYERLLAGLFHSFYRFNCRRLHLENGSTLHIMSRQRQAHLRLLVDLFVS